MSRNRYHENERDVLSTALHVISTERDALTHLECLYSTNELAQKNMERAVSQLVHTINRGGKLVVCGVGKSGKIGRKLEATMNSVGIHSVFLHPTEALHGDLGVIRSIDTLLLISFSGRTAELLLMLPHVPPTVSIIAITSHTHPSTCPLLSFNSPDMSILLPAPLHVDEESSFGLSAPTSSTTVALALGDALALAAAQKLHTVPGQGPAEIFKGFHPGGAIGAAVATAAAINSAISTPSTSMTTSPSLTSLEDVRNKLSLDDSSVTTSANSKAELLCTAEHFVAADCIPTVLPSQQSEKEVPLRILDILLCAIQNPTSKSWLKLSDTQIIPPTLLRHMTQTHAQKSSRNGNASYYKIDAPISDLCGLTTSVDATEWIPMRASTSIEEAKSILEDMRDITSSMLSGTECYQDSDAHQRHKYIVISIVDDNDSDRILGFVAGEDIYPSPCFHSPSVPVETVS